MFGNCSRRLKAITRVAHRVTFQKVQGTARSWSERKEELEATCLILISYVSLASPTLPYIGIDRLGFSLLRRSCGHRA